MLFMSNILRQERTQEAVSRPCALRFGGVVQVSVTLGVVEGRDLAPKDHDGLR